VALTRPRRIRVSTRSAIRVELARVALEFNRVHHGRLRQLIDALNALSPPGAATPARS